MNLLHTNSFFVNFSLISNVSLVFFSRVVSTKRLFYSLAGVLDFSATSNFSVKPCTYWSLSIRIFANFRMDIPRTQKHTHTHTTATERKKIRLFYLPILLSCTKQRNQLLPNYIWKCFLAINFCVLATNKATMKEREKQRRKKKWTQMRMNTLSMHTNRSKERKKEPNMTNQRADDDNDHVDYQKSNGSSGSGRTATKSNRKIWK